MKKFRKFYLSLECEAWTFIETLLVMALVMILTASIGISYVGQLDKAKVVSAKTQIETLSMALDNFYLDMGFYPSEADGLSYLYFNKNNLYSQNWAGPYISKQIPKDPWGNDYIYTVPGSNNSPYEILSLGKDGLRGGQNYDQDISNLFWRSKYFARNFILHFYFSSLYFDFIKFSLSSIFATKNKSWIIKWIRNMRKGNQWKNFQDF